MLDLGLATIIPNGDGIARRHEVNGVIAGDDVAGEERAFRSGDADQNLGLQEA